MAEISPLRRRMIEDMTVRNLCPATQQSYLNAVSKFSRYPAFALSRRPRQVGKCRQQHRQLAGRFISLRGRHSTAHQVLESVKFAARGGSGTHFD